MKKQIFIVRGVSNSGKTHTVNYIADPILEQTYKAIDAFLKL